jgi:hypothetical protein
MKKLLLLVSILFIMTTGDCQVNGYAKVTGILGPVLNISNSNETYDQFNIGDNVIVMQMQDDVIGANTGNNSSFGNLSTIANAGKFELATVALVARVGGLVNVITLTGPLSGTYSLNSNSSLQLITFPTFGNPNYTTGSNITAVPWDGNTGGVVAFNVNGKLLLNHNITADNAGFKGGAMDANNATDASCDNTTFFSATSVLHGNKGEGLYKVTNANYAAAIGHIINGGGGGNGHNAGGGGGSNFSGGGDGAIGYNCTTISGGFGGSALNTSINSLRFFLGGGGGSGEANNGGNNKGGNGGGIVLVRANELQPIGAGVKRISANGEAGGSVGNDGAGGGGAGGTLLLEVNTWTVASTAPLLIEANAGNGGNVGDGARHGGGAGGGQGAVIFTSLIPSANTTITSTNGIGGVNWTGGARAPGGTGTNNAGVITSGFVVLPLNLVSFSAVSKPGNTLLQWVTENETAISRFEIEYSENGSDFSTIARMNAKGNRNSAAVYNYNSTSNGDVQYYRLKTITENGKASYSKIIVLRKTEVTATTTLSIYPNPAIKNPVLNIKATEVGNVNVAILGMHGHVLSSEKAILRVGDNPIVLQSVNNLPAAVYTVRVIMNGKSQFARLVIQK